MEIRYPIIPTEIVVHLGAPNEAAKNITVPFQEYIKNVASNEIYPNWPKEAIKANILAQISFALNRIYNEWYPSQGYSFDITSDPIYDQAFNENSQFFENISQIVDDIFNNYIVSGNQVQPLFATYCDGKLTKCNGLSQWGTVDLANEGKNYEEILKYYYGDNIKIIENAPVEPNIMTYPGFPLRIGVIGDYVRALNLQLNRISQNYPAIPKIKEEGVYFTVDTEEAVKKFQEIFNLPITGIVDKATWYKIKYIYNAVKKIADLYSEGISIDDVKLLFKKQLQINDVDYSVRTLNYMLNVISYFNNNILFLDLTGEKFNEDTKNVVKSFQEEYSIPVTGIVDANTWRSIREAYEQTLNSIPEEYIIYRDEIYPGYFISKGMSGPDVLRLQNFLYIICENTKEIPGVKVTGIFDDLTEQSVKYLQKKFGIEDTGIVGAVTWNNIVELSKNK